MRLFSIGILLWRLSPLGAAESNPSRFHLTVVDQRTQEPVPARVHLKDPLGKPIKPAGYPYWRDHFVCPGTAELDLPAGEYAYEVERGPEYGRRGGRLTASGKSDQIVVALERLVDLAAEGWWSGELHVHRPPEEIELLMRAEDLHVAPVITWWNEQNPWKNRAQPETPLVRFDQNRCYQLMGGEDEREGGALLYFNLPAPLAITGATREYPSPMEFLKRARPHPGAWIDIEKPFWWDVPIWLASGEVHSIGLANNHMCRDQMYEDEAWGKPRDAQRLPAPRGNGYWTQEIYYHILNCGLRLPPSAGSASGVLPNPVGYNRVYVYLGKSFDHDRWWDGLRAGRSFVSNGPLLRCRANGELPGHIFRISRPEGIEVDLEGALTSQDPISSIEIIRNGRVERIIPADELRRTGRLGRIQLVESGWFLVRAVAENPKTFRFASTAPFYVETESKPRRISKASAQFFLDWVRERKQRVRLDDPKQRAEVLSYHEMAERFWAGRVAQANAD